MKKKKKEKKRKKERKKSFPWHKQDSPSAKITRRKIKDYMRLLRCASCNLLSPKNVA